MPPRVQHIVETRFSVRPGGDGPQGLAIEGWLEERLPLLRRFCLPSVMAQDAEFTWLVLCDADTDPEILCELRGAARSLPAFELGITGPEHGIRQAALAAVDPDTDVLITTQLDSDDALADGCLAAIQAYADSFHRSAHPDLVVNFPRGYRLDARKNALYEDRMSNSSFPSLFERPSTRNEAMTVLCGPGHATLRQECFTHQDESMHAWLIVVHGGNVINRIRSDHPRADLAAGLSRFSLADDAVEIFHG